MDRLKFHKRLRTLGGERQLSLTQDAGPASYDGRADNYLGRKRRNRWGAPGGPTCGPDGGQEVAMHSSGRTPNRKRKSRWEDPAPTSSLVLANVPKEITLPGGIKVWHSTCKGAVAPRIVSTSRYLKELISVGLSPACPFGWQWQPRSQSQGAPRSVGSSQPENSQQRARHRSRKPTITQSRTSVRSERHKTEYSRSACKGQAHADSQQPHRRTHQGRSCLSATS